jgi:hypothetical protein
MYTSTYIRLVQRSIAKEASTPQLHPSAILHPSILYKPSRDIHKIVELHRRQGLHASTRTSACIEPILATTHRPGALLQPYSTTRTTCWHHATASHHQPQLSSHQNTASLHHRWWPRRQIRSAGSELSPSPSMPLAVRLQSQPPSTPSIVIRARA